MRRVPQQAPGCGAGGERALEDHGLGGPAREEEREPDGGEPRGGPRPHRRLALLRPSAAGGSAARCQGPGSAAPGHAGPRQSQTAARPWAAPRLTAVWLPPPLPGGPSQGRGPRVHAPRPHRSRAPAAPRGAWLPPSGRWGRRDVGRPCGGRAPPLPAARCSGGSGSRPVCPLSKGPPAAGLARLAQEALAAESPEATLRVAAPSPWPQHRPPPPPPLPGGPLDRRGNREGRGGGKGPLTGSGGGAGRPRKAPGWAPPSGAFAVAFAVATSGARGSCQGGGGGGGAAVAHWRGELVAGGCGCDAGEGVTSGTAHPPPPPPLAPVARGAQRGPRRRAGRLRRQKSGGRAGGCGATSGRLVSLPFARTCPFGCGPGAGGRAAAPVGDGRRRGPDSSQAWACGPSNRAWAGRGCKGGGGGLGGGRQGGPARGLAGCGHWTHGTFAVATRRPRGPDVDADEGAGRRRAVGRGGDRCARAHGAMGGRRPAGGARGPPEGCAVG